VAGRNHLSDLSLVRFRTAMPMVSVILKGILKRLDYLKELGITAIWLIAYLPVANGRFWVRYF
jgi:hypothetical protein